MIYFDHNATTPILPEVKEVMAEAMHEYWGNPSSGHTMGKKAADKLAFARNTLAELLSVSSEEIVFTSGGTEADNLSILGIVEPTLESAILISDIEHPAVSDTADYLVRHGVCCERIPIDNQGIVQVETLANAVNEKVKLISVMFANNEIGTIQPMKEIGEIAAQNSILFHSDAVQAFGKVPLNVVENNISLCAISSHKIYGPKGCGALYVKKGVPLNPRTYGGGQEHGLRTGTQNLPAILGFVEAAQIAYNKMSEEKQFLMDLTEYMYTEISSCIENVIRNGHPQKRIPGTLNLSFPGVISEMVVEELIKERICMSGGAACHSGTTEPSHVLLALGRRKQEAVAGVRFSLGRASNREEVDVVVKILKRVIESLRDLNS